LLYRLFRLWSWAYFELPDGDVTHLFEPRGGLRKAQDVLRLRSTKEAARLLDALKGAAFLERDGDGNVRIYDWHEWGGRRFAEREASRETSRRYREKLLPASPEAAPLAFIGGPPGDGHRDADGDDARKKREQEKKPGEKPGNEPASKAGRWPRLKKGRRFVVRPGEEPFEPRFERCFVTDFDLAANRVELSDGCTGITRTIDDLAERYETAFR
jgi:hypothetical protein